MDGKITFSNFKVWVESCSYSELMQRNENHDTLLHEAARNNKPKFVRLLLSKGADPNALNLQGNSAQN